MQSEYISYRDLIIMQSEFIFVSNIGTFILFYAQSTRTVVSRQIPTDPPVWWTLISFRKLHSELTWLQRLQLELIILSSETAVWIYLSPTDNLQSHEFISYRNSSLNLSPTEILQSKFVSYRDSVVQLHLRVHLLQRLQSEFVSYRECSLSLSPTETAVWVCLLQRL